MAILYDFDRQIAKKVSPFRKGETFNALAAAPRNVCRLFAHPGILKVQRTGISGFIILRCSAPFGVVGNVVITNITGALHLASFVNFTISTLSQTKGFTFRKR
jgi:hypothetical protein